ncbi:MAG: hypothetical protein LAO06_07725 [Acidobacteriia bacterium]|nr:hypothetical protein [Terriglobia bacterium]
MLCAELERLESEFDDIVTALEDRSLPEQRRKELEDAYARIARAIRNHQADGHEGRPCFELIGRY